MSAGGGASAGILLGGIGGPIGAIIGGVVGAVLAWGTRVGLAIPKAGNYIAFHRNSSMSAAADVLVASTGVIGRPYPMDRVRSYFEGELALDRTDALWKRETLEARPVHLTGAVASCAAAGTASACTFFMMSIMSALAFSNVS